MKELAKNDLTHHERDGLEEVECFAELVEIAAFLFEDFEGLDKQIAIGGEEAVLEVEAAESAFAGLEVETALGAGFSEDRCDFGVGVLRAEVEDELLVCGGETIENGHFFHNSGVNYREGGR